MARTSRARDRLFPAKLFGNLVDGIHEHPCVFRIVLRVHAVPQIGDVATGPEALEHPPHFAPDRRRVGEEHRWIEITLQSVALSNALAGGGRIHGPIEAYHVVGTPVQHLEGVMSPSREDDRRYIRMRILDAPGYLYERWHHECLILDRSQQTGPRIENLHGAGPRSNLAQQMSSNHICEARKKLPRGILKSVQPAPHLHKMLAAAPLHHIGH